MDLVRPFLAFLDDHRYVAVFAASVIDATGIPFPARIVLVLAGAVAATSVEVALTITAGAVGAVLGDHVLYAAGRRGGASVLALYCRLILGSEGCIEDTIQYFRRFGPWAILLGRYSTSVRLFAAILSGCGNIHYARFLRYDALGTAVYATLWVVVGHLFGDELLTVLEWVGRRHLVVVIVPAGVAAILAYRVWRRRTHGADGRRRGPSSLDHGHDIDARPSGAEGEPMSSVTAPSCLRCGSTDLELERAALNGETAHDATTQKCRRCGARFVVAKRDEVSDGRRPGENRSAPRGRWLSPPPTR